MNNTPWMFCFDSFFKYYTIEPYKYYNMQLSGARFKLKLKKRNNLL